MGTITNPVIAALLERRTCRSFKPEQIDDSVIETILETGRYAATARGRQPQHFTVIQSQGLCARIVAAVKHGLSQMNDEHSQQNAKNPEYNTFYKAPTVIFVSADPKVPYAEADCANAVQNMAVAAHSLGIGSCYIASMRLAFAGPDGLSLLKELGMPEGATVQFALALGFAAASPAAAAPRKNLVNWIR